MVTLAPPPPPLGASVYSKAVPVALTFNHLLAVKDEGVSVRLVNVLSTYSRAVPPALTFKCFPAVNVLGVSDNLVNFVSNGVYSNVPV